MDKQFHPTFYRACDYLSMIGLSFIHVSKRGSGVPSYTAHPSNMCSNSQTKRIHRASPTNNSVEPLKRCDAFHIADSSDVHSTAYTDKKQKQETLTLLTSDILWGETISIRWTHTQGWSNRENPCFDIFISADINQYFNWHSTASDRKLEFVMSIMIPWYRGPSQRWITDLRKCACWDFIVIFSGIGNR